MIFYVTARNFAVTAGAQAFDIYGGDLGCGGPGGSDIYTAHQCGRCYRKDISLIEYPTEKKMLLPHFCGPVA